MVLIVPVTHSFFNRPQVLEETSGGVTSSNSSKADSDSPKGNPNSDGDDDDKREDNSIKNSSEPSLNQSSTVQTSSLVPEVSLNSNSTQLSSLDAQSVNATKIDPGSGKSGAHIVVAPIAFVILSLVMVVALVLLANQVQKSANASNLQKRLTKHLTMGFKKNESARTDSPKDLDEKKGAQPQTLGTDEESYYPYIPSHAVSKESTVYPFEMSRGDRGMSNYSVQPEVSDLTLSNQKGGNDHPRNDFVPISFEPELYSQLSIPPDNANRNPPNNSTKGLRLPSPAHGRY
ncbi:hypothetical protein BY996DRAFT_6410750 [Phakopsora pachyrhizi]|nr:hypothetical protein BY996DRAFT_6410750 [Phakopsora pachyrhizi]